MSKKLSFMEWIPVIEDCLKQEKYGNMASCSLCLAAGYIFGWGTHFCDRCIVFAHNEVIKPTNPDPDPCPCERAIEHYGADGYDRWLDIPAIHRWLNALLTWTKKMAEQEAREKCESCERYSYSDFMERFPHTCKIEGHTNYQASFKQVYARCPGHSPKPPADKPCDGCVWLKTWDEVDAMPREKSRGHSCGVKWQGIYCFHPQADDASNHGLRSDRLSYKHFGDKQTKIHAHCPGKQTELWGVRDGPKIFGSMVPFARGKLRFADGSVYPDEKGLWFSSEKEAHAGIAKHHAPSWVGLVPVRVDAEGNEIKKPDSRHHGKVFLQGMIEQMGSEALIREYVNPTTFFGVDFSNTKEKPMSEKTISLKDIYDDGVSMDTFQAIEEVWPYTGKPKCYATLNAKKVYELLDTHFPDKKCWYGRAEKLVGPRPQKKVELRELKVLPGAKEGSLWISENGLYLIGVAKASGGGLSYKEVLFNALRMVKLSNFAKAIEESDGWFTADWPEPYKNKRTLEIIKSIDAEARKEAGLE
jgi:hypothetical protein